MTSDVFLSYSSHDSDTAQVICSALEAAGLSCWIAPRNILPGRTWSEAIIEGIKGAELMLLLFTSASNASPQVLREVERAVSKKMDLITVRIEDIAPSQAMEYLISVEQWFDAHTSPIEDHLTALIQTVRSLLASHSTDGERELATQQAFSQLHQIPSLPPHNLPVQMNSFIGREKEMAEVKSLLTRTHLLTLTAVGGSGKTRLALQIGIDLLPEYRHGVWLVELAALTDPALVPQAVAETLAIREAPGHSLLQTLIQSLIEKELLLLMDNCEHLLSGVVNLVDPLLQHVPHLRILATSRERLGIDGEQIYQVPCLTLPERNKPMAVETLDQYEAIHLFIDRAAFSKPDFALTDRNAEALVSLCQHLDGIPLAIELAAARVRALSVEEINARLDHRFHLLTGGSRDALPRHQTLKALLDWSYDLLNNQEKTLLQRLSVFSGGWTLDAAEQVCADAGKREKGKGKSGESTFAFSLPSFPSLEEWEVMDLLLSLSDKSLVVYEEKDEQGRYRLLETVRAYARDQLSLSGEGDRYQRQHLIHFLTLAEEANSHARGADQAVWLERLEGELENLRAALQTAQQEANGETILRMVGALRWFWHLRGYLNEGREWTDTALSHPGAQVRNAARAKALAGAGNLAGQQGEYAMARTYQEQSLEIYRELGDRHGIAFSLSYLGMAAQNLGDYASATSYHQESMEIARELGEEQSIAQSLNNLGLVAYYQGDYASARPLFEESLQICRRLGNQQGIYWALSHLGNVAKDQGDHELARSLYEESLEICRGSKDRWSMALCLGNLGNVAKDQGDLASSYSLYARSLEIFRELGDQQGVAITLGNMANAAREQGDHASARPLYEESLQISRKLGDIQGVAWSLGNLGLVAIRQGEDALARTLYTESLNLRKEIGDKLGILACLEGFALLAVKEKQLEKAAQLWGAAEVLRDAIGTPIASVGREEYDQHVAQTRSVLGEEAFASAWAEGGALLLEQAIALAQEDRTSTDPSERL